MKKALVFLVVAALLSGVSGAWAKDGAELVGLYTVPGTSFTVRCIKFEHDDAWRHNQTVMATITTDVDRKGNVVNTVAGHDSASSTGIANGFFVGGFAGLAQGAGIVGAGALIRPDSGATQVNQGGNAQQSQGQRMKQQQQQAQNQSQVGVNNPVNVNSNAFVPTNTNTFNPTNKVANQNGAVLSSISQ